MMTGSVKEVSQEELFVIPPLYYYVMTFEMIPAHLTARVTTSNETA